MTSLFLFITVWYISSLSPSSCHGWHTHQACTTSPFRSTCCTFGFNVCRSAWRGAVFLSSYKINSITQASTLEKLCCVVEGVVKIEAGVRNRTRCRSLSRLLEMLFCRVLFSQVPASYLLKLNPSPKSVVSKWVLPLPLSLSIPVGLFSLPPMYLHFLSDWLCVCFWLLHFLVACCPLFPPTVIYIFPFF